MSQPGFMNMLLFDQALVSVLLVLLVYLVLWDLELWLKALGEVGWGLVAMVLAALAFRLFMVQPALVHGDWQGPGIVQSVLDFPVPGGTGPGSYGRNYGQGSFVVLGILSRILGENPAGVLKSNVIVSALATVPLALVAASWAGSRFAGLLAAGLWASSGLVGRLSHSEDAHLVGVFFGLISLAYAELARRHPDRILPLLGAGVAALLAAWSRETCYAFAFFALALVSESHIRRLRSNKQIPRRIAVGWGVVCTLVGLMIVFRFKRSYSLSNIYGWLIEDMLRDPRLILGLVLDHPFFDFRRLSPMVGLFGLSGVVWLALARSRLAVAAGFLLMAILTLPAGIPYIGMAWSFRLPVYAVAIAASGGTLLVVFEWLSRHRQWLRQRGARMAAVVLVALFGMVGSVTAENRQPDGVYLDYAWFWDLASELPKESVLIASPLELRLPLMAIARQHGLEVVTFDKLPESPPSQHWYLPAGLAAWAYTLSEVTGHENVHAEAGMLPESLRPFLVSLWDRRTNYGMAYVENRRPTQERPEYGSFLERCELISQGPKVSTIDAIPHAIFARPEVELALYRWAH